LKNSANIIRFSGLDLSPVGGAADPRTMGIGLCSIVISGDPCRETGDCVGEAGDTTRKVSLEGVIYTSVLNPADDRKNWSDMVKAFCIAFRDVEDATLVLKMTHHSLASFLGELHFLLQIMGTFKCRIVVLHGYLDKKEYEKLVESTHFYVNSSWCEGLCLPLMEFMSCGKPAIAPEHTSFADYIDESTTLIVRAGVDPYIWRHDPRELLRTLKYRIDFESLIDAYMQSYDITKKQPDVYSKMAKSASSKMKDYTSNYVIKRKLENFFNRDGLQW
jgi:glycosyltransferase involved in cell wall biosynthesis